MAMCLHNCIAEMQLIFYKDNANRAQWQCACTIALPRCSLSSTKIHKNPELLASRDKEITCRYSIDNQLNISVQ